MAKYFYFLKSSFIEESLEYGFLGPDCDAITLHFYLFANYRNKKKDIKKTAPKEFLYRSQLTHMYTRDYSLYKMNDMSATLGSW